MKRAFLLLYLLINVSIAAEIKVGGANFPYIFETRGNSVVGVGPDIINQIFKDSNLNVTFHTYPWKRTLKELQYGNLNIVVGTYKTSERLRKYVFSKYPFYQDKIVLYSSNKTKVRWDGHLESLKSKTIAVVDGWSYGEMIDKKIKGLNVVTKSSAYKCLTVIAKKRIDYCLMNLRDASGMLKRYNIENVIREKNTLDVADVYFSFSKINFNKDIYNKFNESLKSLIDDGSVRKIVKKYIP